MTDPERPSRRDFLGFLGLALLDPAISSPTGAGRAVGRRAYLGPVRDLIASLPLESGWGFDFFALIESIDVPTSEWIVGPVSSLALTARRPVEGWPTWLRSHGVVRACEADVSPAAGATPSTSYFVDVTLFEDVTRCEAVWRGLESVAGEAGLDPYEGPGEAAVLSSGKWSLAGKVFFRRANVLASVVAVPPTDGPDARRFAVALDGRIAALVSPNAERRGRL